MLKRFGRHCERWLRAGVARLQNAVVFTFQSVPRSINSWCVIFGTRPISNSKDAARARESLRFATAAGGLPSGRGEVRRSRSDAERIELWGLQGHIHAFKSMDSRARPLQLFRPGPAVAGSRRLNRGAALALHLAFDLPAHCAAADESICQIALALRMESVVRCELGRSRGTADMRPSPGRICLARNSESLPDSGHAGAGTHLDHGDARTDRDRFVAIGALSLLAGLRGAEPGMVYWEGSSGAETATGGRFPGALRSCAAMESLRVYRQ